jgi:hypothetical protein
MTRGDGLIRTPDGDLVPDVDDDLDVPPPVDNTPRSADEIRAHANELRAILRAAKARREVDQ